MMVYGRPEPPPNCRQIIGTEFYDILGHLLGNESVIHLFRIAIEFINPLALTKYVSRFSSSSFSRSSNFQARKASISVSHESIMKSEIRSARRSHRAGASPKPIKKPRPAPPCTTRVIPVGNPSAWQFRMLSYQGVPSRYRGYVRCSAGLPLAPVQGCRAERPHAHTPPRRSVRRIPVERVPRPD